jgi:hypothetical protein
VTATGGEAHAGLVDVDITRQLRPMGVKIAGWAGIGPVAVLD